MTSGALGVMDRPVAQPGDLPFLQDKSLLMSTNPGDTPLLSGLFGEGAASSSLPSATPAVEEGVEEPCKGDGPKTRLQKRLNALCYGCRELLDSFTKDTWARTPESQFTKMANTAAAILVESRQLAESEATLDAATAWSNGLASGNNFMMLFRSYEKSNHKPERLTEVLPPLSTFAAFLADTTKRVVAPTLTRLLLQATFRTEARDFASAAPACSKLVENGLVSNWKQGVPPGGNTGKLAEVWLRTLIHDPIATDLLALTNADDKQQLLLADVDGIHKVLSKVSDTGDGRVFRPVAEDMHAMRVVLSAWTP